jgi:hypothetical protein
MEPYYATKAEIQDRVREAGFAHWTLLKPSCSTPDMAEEEAVAAGLSDAGHGQAALIDHPQPAHPSHTWELGLPTTDFETWAHAHLSPTA